jgi:two-component system chemotaxis response regulator CheY
VKSLLTDRANHHYQANFVTIPSEKSGKHQYLLQLINSKTSHFEQGGYMKILVVDDSGIMRRLIGNAVSMRDYEPLEANDGAQALTKLQKQSAEIALIILDWNMPVMDGYETLVAIRSKREYDHIPVLMATTEGVKENVIKALKAGADNYLVKPFKPEILQKKIVECLFPKTKTGKRN